MYNNNQIGKVYQGSGGQLEKTSDVYDLFQTGTGLLAATGNPFAAVLTAGFNILDSLFCGRKCHARRQARAKASGSKIGAMCNYSNCYNRKMGAITIDQKPKVF